MILVTSRNLSDVSDIRLSAACFVLHHRGSGMDFRFGRSASVFLQKRQVGGNT